MATPETREGPITAAEALREEFIQLHGAAAPTYQAWLDALPAGSRLGLFHKDHFKDPCTFITRLLEPTTPLARFLREQLSPETARRLADCPRSTSVCEVALDLLARDLNCLLVGPSLYEEARFAGISLSEETRARTKRPLSGQPLALLNRVLLEEAFPGLVLPVWDTMAGFIALAHTRNRTALCLSGGGIRSATFGLGVLQGLARHGLLGQFDYLSTVSGGGYIGSWLSSWIHHAGSPEKAFEALKNENVASPLEPEPKPLRHLRQFSNYLTPRLGTFSADTWTLIGTFLRNLFLNWLVFVPLLFAALALPRLGVSILRLPVEPWGMTTLLIVGFVSCAISIAYGSMQRPGLAALLQKRRLFWSRRGDQISFLLYCLLPLCLSAVCFTTFWAWLPLLTSERPSWWIFALGGPALHLSGWLLSAAVLRRFNWKEISGVLITGAVGGLGIGKLAMETFTMVVTVPDLLLYVCFAVPAFLAVFLVTAALFIGLSSYGTTDSDREWWARMGAWVLIVIVAWSGFGSLSLFAPLLLLSLSPLLTWMGGLPGLFSVVVGYGAGSSPTKDDAAQASWPTRMRNWGLAMAAPLFIVIVAAWISLGTTRGMQFWPGLDDKQHRDHLQLVYDTPLNLIAVVILGCTMFGLLMSWLINLNRFSLHSVYRNRLIRAYLGASNPQRDPNPFTGFDPRDNLRLAQLAGQRPLHVVNMALNLVADDNLAWQQRKAETFTASPLHAGNYRLGYRSSREYASGSSPTRGLSLGTAVTISGAAASPNQGYHSSPTVALLMTLFNVRLGAWLGNPGRAGEQTYRNLGPRSGAFHLLKEAFGLTNDDSGYVYLSDGGHFENLGLYEMVLRRCHYIVVSDAGCDPKCQLEDLGNAIRKIRVDLGVPIEMRRFNIRSRTAGEAGQHCAIGEIHYDKVDGPGAKRGLLVYVKPSISGDEPRDVFNYQETCRAFPHESTGDQWFSESQFESYRMLGLHIINEMAQDWAQIREYSPDQNALGTFIRQAYKYLGTPLPADFDQCFALLAFVPPTIAESRATSVETTAPPAATEAPKSF